jgi:putative membrane protein
VTTASTACAVPFRDNRFLHRLCVAMLAVILIEAYRPEKVFDFWLENATAMTFLAVLAFTYRRLALSQWSYVLIFVYLSFHEWGAHYKYSDVPLGEWMKPWLHTHRNHYDRVMHFAYGFLLSYPMQEMFMRGARVRGRWLYVLPVEMTLACSACYEMLEAFMASILTPERGEEFVGMQGDLWDSQKDMFMAGVGALLAVAIIAAIRSRRRVAALEEAPVRAYAARYKQN